MQRFDLRPGSDDDIAIAADDFKFGRLADRISKPVPPLQREHAPAIDTLDNVAGAQSSGQQRRRKLLVHDDGTIGARLAQHAKNMSVCVSQRVDGTKAWFHAQGHDDDSRQRSLASKPPLRAI
jgi:hypothetical protein